MKSADHQMELLRLLASMPLLDRLEMAQVCGLSRSAVYDAADRLARAGLVASVSHASELTPPARRFCLTADGVQTLARHERVSVDELLRNVPASRQWRRILLERLDAVAVIHRLVSAVAGVVRPIRLRLYRASPLDAALELSDGRTLGVVRYGNTADPTAFAKRLWRLGQGPLPGAVLVLVPDRVRLRRVQRLLSRTSVNALLALEREAAPADGEVGVWHTLHGAASLSLGYALQRLRPGGRLPEEAPPSEPSLPGDLAEDLRRASAALLKPAEKRALDLLAGWPWLSQKDMAGMLRLSETRVSRTVAPLAALGLAARHPAANGRLALTDLGLACLARRDRASVAMARRRWSVKPGNSEGAEGWRKVSGGRSRQLLRNLEHTAAVHGFLAALARHARGLGWEVLQLDPPHRASRHFRHGGGLGSVYPDAFGVLGKVRATWPFFLEWERRAVRPSTMLRRLAPYLRYYSTQRPADDHGTAPAVLVVFDDPIAATHFLSLAEREIGAAGVQLPLLVAHRREVEDGGPLGRAWRSPGRWEPVSPLPAL